MSLYNLNREGKSHTIKFSLAAEFMTLPCTTMHSFNPWGRPAGGIVFPLSWKQTEVNSAEGFNPGGSYLILIMEMQIKLNKQSINITKIFYWV